MAENEFSGSVQGAALQAKNINGGVHLYGHLTGQPGLVSVAVPERRVEQEIHGRAEMLSDLKSRTGLVVLCGAGGFGKTTVALALAKELKVDRPAWWVDASTAEGLVAGLREVALASGAVRDEVSAAWQGEMSAPDLLWRTLERLDKPWLLVVDNADEPSFVTDWIRTPECGLVVVTSRESRKSIWGRRTPILPMVALSDVDGGAVLRELAPLAGDVADARQLSQRLGGVPLALWVTGRLLEQASSTPSVPGLEEPRTFGALQDQIETVRSGDEIGQTWELSLDALARRGKPFARPLFRLLSFFGPMPVPTCLLNAKIMADVDIFAGIQPHDVAQTLVELMSAGLLDLGQEMADTVILHPLVRETSRYQADALRDAADYDDLCAALLGAVVELLSNREAENLPLLLLLKHAVNLVRSRP